jgi:uncharacterized protein (TIGR02453 family)
MFQGFTNEAVDFMYGIHLNNDKTWFEAHKEIYLNSFYNPMRELAGEIYDYVTDKLPDAGLTVKVSRIYRDARRLHGNGPYKDHLWWSIQRPADAWSPEPCFWFELGPDYWGYGMGCYAVKPLTMAKLRARMDANPAPMEKLTRKISRQNEFTLDNPTYKKPKGPAPSKLLEPWYLMKGYSLTHTGKLDEQAFSRDIVARVEKGYDFLIPFYQYFSTLDADPDPRDE